MKKSRQESKEDVASIHTQTSISAVDCLLSSWRVHFGNPNIIYCSPLTVSFPAARGQPSSSWKSLRKLPTLSISANGRGGSKQRKAGGQVICYDNRNLCFLCLSHIRISIFFNFYNSKFRSKTVPQLLLVKFLETDANDVDQSFPVPN